MEVFASRPIHHDVALALTEIRIRIRLLFGLATPSPRWEMNRAVFNLHPRTERSGERLGNVSHGIQFQFVSRGTAHQLRNILAGRARSMRVNSKVTPEMPGFSLFSLLQKCRNDCTCCFLSNLKMPCNELLAVSRHLASCILNSDWDNKFKFFALSIDVISIQGRTLLKVLVC